MSNNINQLEKRIALLEECLINTLWMARRYAHNRSTYAPHVVNTAIDILIELGIYITPDVDNDMYADDGMFGKWNSELKKFIKD